MATLRLGPAGTRLREMLTLVVASILILGPAYALVAAAQQALLGGENPAFSGVLIALIAGVAGLFALVAASAAESNAVRSRRHNLRDAALRFARDLELRRDGALVAERLAAFVGELVGRHADVWLAGGAAAAPMPIELLRATDAAVMEPHHLRAVGRETLAACLDDAHIDACVPLVAGERLIGLVVLRCDARPAALTEDERDGLAVFAATAGFALENQRLHAELARSVDLVQRANRLASLGMLTAGLAHEVRNPLVAIRAFAQLLPERWDDAEFRRDFGEAVLSEIDRMGDLINDLLRAARSNQASLEEHARVHDTVMSVVPLLKAQAKRKRITLEVSTDPSEPFVAAGTMQVRQVVMNLVLNAIEATPPGGSIRIATGHHDGAGHPGVFLRVADSGPGIPTADRAKVFDPFFTTREEGTGLGLAITRQIVHEHGGTIDIETAPGAGAAFVVALPAVAEPATEAAARAG